MQAAWNERSSCGPQTSSPADALHGWPTSAWLCAGSHVLADAWHGWLTSACVCAGSHVLAMG